MVVTSEKVVFWYGSKPEIISVKVSVNKKGKAERRKWARPTDYHMH